MQQNEPRPTAIFSVCAPSDIQGLERWEAHLRPLEQVGTLTIWSACHLQAGVDRLTHLHDHLDHADIIVLLLSVDFFTDEECYSLIERALARHQQGMVRVIPLLLRPVSFRETKLAMFTSLPSDGRPVTQWGNIDAAFDDCVRELRRIIGRPVTGPLTGKSQRAFALQNQNRERMLRRLRRSYSELMSQSLQGTAWLELGLVEKPDAVQNAANLLLRLESGVVQPLPPGTFITQVYDEAEHELLILGEPGAGKSTLLLDLAEHLVTRAETDETHPLPVILPLSSWAVRRPKLEDWIAEQMSEIYDVPRKLSVQWVKEERILPLLDGLDEMEEAARPICIAAINTYHRDHMVPLVICSRTTEYDAAMKRHRLALQGAVVVEPLTHEDVGAYLLQMGKPLAALRSALKKNPALHDLITTPLMLNILILTYQGTSVRSLSNKESLLLQQIWDDYLQRMVARKGQSDRYPLERTQLFLGWLARQMREHNQTVFYLEHLQSDWLETRQQRMQTQRAIGLLVLVIGSLMGIVVPLFFSSFSYFVLTDLSILLRNGVLGGLLGGLWYEAFSKKGRQGERRRVWRKRLALSVCIGLIYGLSFGFYFLRYYPYYTLSDWLNDGLAYGVVMGLSSFLLQYLLTGPLHLSSPIKTGSPRRWKQVVHFFQSVQGPRASLVAVITGLAYGLSYGLSYGLNAKLSYGLGYGLNYGIRYGLTYGLSYGLISLTLGTQMRDLHLTERVRLTWSNLWRGLFNARHLRITVLLACISILFVGLSGRLSQKLSNSSGIFLSDGQSGGMSDSINRMPRGNGAFGFGIGSWEEQEPTWASYLLSIESRIVPSLSLRDELNYGLVYAMSIGLSIGLSYWFLLGFYQGITQERIEDQDRHAANQGIHRSLRNSVLMGIIGGAIIGCIGLLSQGLSYALYEELSYTLAGQYGPGFNSWFNFWLYFYGLNMGPLIGISGALLIFLFTGGLVVWRHYVIRFQLWRSHTFPWNASRFLDDSSARFLLRRVGGGYSFTHRLLLDHLADAAKHNTD